MQPVGDLFGQGDKDLDTGAFSGGRLDVQQAVHQLAAFAPSRPPAGCYWSHFGWQHPAVKTRHWSKERSNLGGGVRSSDVERDVIPPDACERDNIPLHHQYHFF